MYSKKNYGGYILLITIICAIVAIPILIQFANNQQKAVIKLQMPDSYEIGELVVLDASTSEANKIIWKIIPETSNFKAYGKTALFSSTEPIDYTLVLIARNGKDLDCQIFTLPYGKKKVKEEEEKVVLTEFEEQVLSWLTPSNRKGAALRLAQSFKIIARTIENGTYENVDGIILATAYANSDALSQDLKAWKPFLRHFQDYLENDPPTTIKDHTVIWFNMANALEKIFGAPC